MSDTEGGAKQKPDLLVLVAVWDFVAAFLWMVGIVAAVLFAFPFSPGYEGTSVEVGDIFGMVAGSLFLIACTCLAAVSGMGLLRDRRWGRGANIASAALSLFLVPIGTVIGALVVAYLLKPDVREYFASIS